MAQTGDGGQAGAFLRRGVGSRALGMGGAFTALADDPSAGYWNPAGLFRIQFPEIVGTYTILSLDRQYNYISGAVPMGRHGALGASLINFGVSDIEGRNAQGAITGSLTNSENAFYLSYAYGLNSSLSAGISAKYLVHTLADYQSSGVGFDVGFLYMLSSGIALGATVQDIYTQVAWNTLSGLKETYPMTVRGGVCFRPFKNESKITLDYVMVQNQKGRIRAGAELPIVHHFGLRAGYDGERPVGGAYFGMPVNRLLVQADLGFGQDPMDLSYAYRITIRVKFGRTAFDFDSNNGKNNFSDLKGSDKDLFAGFTGRVVRLVAQYPNYGLINAGESSGLRAGVLLNVYRSQEDTGGVNGQKIFVGQVKIVEVRGDMSAVTAFRLREGFSLKLGDFVFK